MTGHRIGYTIANKEVSLAMTKLQGHLTGNNCTFVQYGAILEALKIPSSHLEKQCDEFKKRRDICYEAISNILPCVKPNGAFYVFPKVESFLKPNESAKELCEDILQKTKVAVLPEMLLEGLDLFESHLQST